MTAKKQRMKNRRRAAKLAEQAWEAADEENLELALKIIRRATDLHPANPRLWHDQGLLLLQAQQLDTAARAFEAAIEVAPDFAEGFASLATLRARQGLHTQAVTLQRQAVRCDPDSASLRHTLTAYEALLAGKGVEDAPPATDADADPRREETEAALAASFPGLAARIDGLDWTTLDSRLTARGYAHVPTFLDVQACHSLRAMFGQDHLFAKTVTMDKPHFGRGVYRYFAPPIPQLVAAIRELAYPHVARIANRWQRLLGRQSPFPLTWSAFQDQCLEAGQHTPSPLLIRYGEGGFNAPHQDLRGEVFFPLQLVVVLSPRADSTGANPEAFAGGDFLLCDQPERKPSDRHAVQAGLGDAVFFGTRERLVRIGGVYGLRSVKHGVSTIQCGVRLALGVPFHEFV